MKKAAADRLILIVAGTIAGTLIAVRGLELRLPGMSRPFWGDEIIHNLAVLRARSFTEMLMYIAGQSQPVLDYLLRKLGWFFLFGTQERMWRTPSMAWSLATIVAGFVIALRWTRNRGGSGKAAFVAAAVAGLWIAHHPIEIHYAAEARHYSLVSLMSLLWFAAACLPGPARPGLKAGVSVAFANTHFFGLALVLWDYGVRALGALVRRSRAEAVRQALIGAGIAAFTIALNFRAVRYLAQNPPAPATGSVVSRLLAGFALVPQFWAYLALPALVIGIWALLIVSPRRRDAGPALGIGMIMIPLLVAYARVQSAYGFWDRYWMPFFGLGFVTILLGVEEIRRLIPSRRRWVGYAAAVVALAWMGGARDVARFVPDLAALRMPPRNFSPYFHIYSEIKREPGPMLLIHSQCHAEDIPLMYLTRVDPPYPEGFAIMDGMHCAIEYEDGRRLISGFVARHPEGVVVLDDKNVKRPDPRPPRGDWGASVRRVKSEPVSVWIIRDFRSVGEIRRIAKAVGFTTLEGLWREE